MAKLIRNIAFFDAEYTALSEKDRGIQEMIQCAFIIYQIRVVENRIDSMGNEPVIIYKTFVKPTYNKELSDYIKELTGIEQEHIESGKCFNDVIDDLYSLIRTHKIHHVVVWGPDYALLKSNCSVVACNKIKAACIRNSFIDISHNVSDFLGYDVDISQNKACELLQIKTIEPAHDAYCDAENLSKIIKKIINSDAFIDINALQIQE